MRSDTYCTMAEPRFLYSKGMAIHDRVCYIFREITSQPDEWGTVYGGGGGSALVFNQSWTMRSWLTCWGRRRQRDVCTLCKSLSFHVVHMFACSALIGEIRRCSHEGHLVKLLANPCHFLFRCFVGQVAGNKSKMDQMA